MKALLTHTTLLTLLFSAVSALAQYHDPRALAADPMNATTPVAPKLSGIGEHSMTVTTDNPESQYFFDQGLRLTYAFNHSEALRSFKESARVDPDNAMAWYGQALVLGPNINLPMMPYVVEPAWDALQRAVALREQGTDKERALIDALAIRYAAAPDDKQPVRDQNYAKAMIALSDAFPDDPDIATLTASAIMNTSPWDYWYNDGTPYPSTERVLAMLSRISEQYPQHTGALHYYIHITEAHAPQLGEAAADQLRGLTPNAGHLLHMPSHIYMRLGRYADSYAVNKAASDADAAYIAACNAQGIYPMGYYPHNVHFMIWSAQSMGRSADAMQSARAVAGKIPAWVGDIGAQSPTGQQSDAWMLFETFLSQPLFTMARFGDWQAVLDEPQPPAEARFMTGIWHYSRGLAYSHSDEQRRAKRELRALQKMLNDDALAEYPASLNGAKTLLGIAADVLQGEISAAAGDYETAVASLSSAVRMQDSLLYMEPPDWFMPTRHYLGAVLLEAGSPREAETVYWDDLRKNPDNGYALLGVAQAQAAQGKDNSAMLARFNAAWSNADHELSSSRY